MKLPDKGQDPVFSRRGTVLPALLIRVSPSQRKRTHARERLAIRRYNPSTPPIAHSGPSASLGLETQRADGSLAFFGIIPTRAVMHPVLHKMTDLRKDSINYAGEQKNNDNTLYIKEIIMINANGNERQYGSPLTAIFEMRACTQVRALDNFIFSAGDENPDRVRQLATPVGPRPRACERAADKNAGSVFEQRLTLAPQGESPGDGPSNGERSESIPLTAIF